MSVEGYAIDHSEDESTVHAALQAIIQFFIATEEIEFDAVYDAGNDLLQSVWNIFNVDTRTAILIAAWQEAIRS